MLAKRAFLISDTEVGEPQSYKILNSTFAREVIHKAIVTADSLQWLFNLFYSVEDD